MDKVKLTQQQADAIEEVLNGDGTKPFELVRDHILSSGFVRSEGDLRLIGNLDIDTLIKALYIGYEVEQTPKEVTQEILQVADRLEDLSKDELENLMVKFSTAINYLSEVKSEVMRHISFRPNRE